MNVCIANPLLSYWNGNEDGRMSAVSVAVATVAAGRPDGGKKNTVSLNWVFCILFHFKSS